MAITSLAGLMNYFKSLTSGVNKKYFYIFMFILFLIITAGIYYMYSKNGSSNSRYVENFEDNSSGKTAELMLFHVDWCPHCKTAKPEWDQVKAEYQNKEINGYKVVFTDINCTNETPEIQKLIDTYKIEGYPTIKLIKDGQVIDFDAKPTKDTLSKFLNTVL